MSRNVGNGVDSTVGTAVPSMLLKLYLDGTVYFWASALTDRRSNGGRRWACSEGAAVLRTRAPRAAHSAAPCHAPTGQTGAGADARIALHVSVGGK